MMENLCRVLLHLMYLRRMMSCHEVRHRVGLRVQPRGQLAQLSDLRGGSISDYRSMNYKYPPCNLLFYSFCVVLVTVVEFVGRGVLGF